MPSISLVRSTVRAIHRHAKKGRVCRANIIHISTARLPYAVFTTQPGFSAVAVSRNA